MAGPDLSQIGFQPQGPIYDAPMFAPAAPPQALQPAPSLVDVGALPMQPQGGLYEAPVFGAQQPGPLAFAPADQGLADISRIGAKPFAQTPDKAQAAAMRGRGTTAQPNNARAQGPGGVRGILGKELRNRQGELLSAQGQLDEALQKFDVANQNLVQTQQTGIEAQARGAQAQADAVGAIRSQVAEQQMLDEGERLLEQDAIAAKQAQIDQGYQKLSQERVRDRTSTGQRVLATAAVALAGIGDALMQMGGQQGDAMARTAANIDAAIQRDADEQLRTINAKRETLTAQERAQKDFLAQVGDARAQRQYMIAQKYDELGLISQQIAEGTNSEVKRNAAKELVALSAQQAEAARVQGAQHVAEDTSGRVRAVKDLGFEIQLKQALGAGKEQKQITAYGLRPLTENVSQADADKAKPIVSAAAGLQTMIGKLRQDAKSGSSLSPTQRRISEQRVMSVRAQWNKVLGDESAPNEGQIKALADAFANPKEVNLADVDALYGALESDLRDSVNAKVRPYGFVVDDVSAEPYRGQ